MAQPRVKRSELSTPPEFAGDPIVWAAWLYYEERMTQEEVAERLGVSRASVVNFLQGSARPEHRDHCGCLRAPAIGADRPRIEPPLRPQQLRRHSRRQRRVADLRTRRSGRARLLLDILEPQRCARRVLGPHRALALGPSWLRRRCRASPSSRSRAAPSAPRNSRRSSAPPYRLPNRRPMREPACAGIVSRPDVKKLFMQESSLVEQFRLIRSCTKVLFGVANLSDASTALRSGYMTPEKIKPYVKRGAIAVMSGRFLDADGHTVLGALDEQMIGLTLDEIAQIPERICVARRHREDSGDPLGAARRLCDHSGHRRTDGAGARGCGRLIDWPRVGLPPPSGTAFVF